MPFPDYLEISDPRKRKSAQEVETGRRRVLRDMAVGLINSVSIEIDPNRKFMYYLDAEGYDFREWQVIIKGHPNGSIVAKDLFCNFPTEELRATLILLGV